MCGEALVDLVQRPGETAPVPHPGGGPFNTAVALGRLGCPVGFLGRLSTDELGVRLRETLVAAGVDLRYAISTDDPTTRAIAEIDEGGRAVYTFDIVGTSAPGLVTDDLPSLDGIEILHLGTLGLLLEPMASSLEALVQRADPEIVVVLDLNVRLALVDDLDSYRLRLEELARQASLVKASDDDLAALYPAVAPEKAARALAATSGALVAMTIGADGVVVVDPTGAGTVTVAAPRVDVVDTIGAGDTFNAALLSWIHSHGGGVPTGDSLELALRYAVTAAAITCTRAGADPPTAAEVEEEF